MWRVPEKLEAGECLLSALLREEFLSVTQCWQLTIAHVQGVNLQAERQDVIAADWWSEPQLSAAPACCARLKARHFLCFVALAEQLPRQPDASRTHQRSSIESLRVDSIG